MSAYRDTHGFVPDPYEPPPPESMIDRLARLCTEHYTTTRVRPTRVRFGSGVHQALGRAVHESCHRDIPYDARAYTAVTGMRFASPVGTVECSLDISLRPDDVVVE